MKSEIGSLAFSRNRFKKKFHQFYLTSAATVDFLAMKYFATLRLHGAPQPANACPRQVNLKSLHRIKRGP
jgi:hypothetical protein